MKPLIWMSMLLLAACGDGHSGDEEEGHHSTYELANSDTAADTGGTHDTGTGTDSQNNGSAEPVNNGVE